MRSHRLAFVAALGISTLLEPSSAAVFTVGGPQGTSTLDQALAQSFALAGDDEIRLHIGDLDVGAIARVQIAADNDLAISGGWNDTFTSRSTAAGTTRLRLGSPAAVLDITQTGGTGLITGLALTRTPGAFGRGLAVSLSGG
jgi:hypothetical protein